MISANAAMTCSYDYSEVARSVLIAIAASYAALDLAGRVTAASGRARLAWLSGGATAMGIGIWAMHFKGMLAFRLPVPVEYHWPTVLLSLVVAILASAFALYVVSRQKLGLVEALTGSVILGGGIAGVHYIGMAAMRLSAITQFSFLLVTFSIFLAVLFSLLALLLAFDLREETKWTVPRRLGSATLMGAAVSAMHYTGMAAASFIPASPPDLSHAVRISPLGNNAIAIVTLIVMVAAMATSSVDRRTEAEVRRLNQDLEQRVAERTLQLEALNHALRKEIAERKRAEEALRQTQTRTESVLESVADIHILFDRGWHYLYVNRAAVRAIGSPREQILGRTLWELFPDIIGTELDRQYRRAMGERFPVVFDFYYPTLNTWWENRFYPAPEGLSVFATNITDRKSAERVLQETQAKLARVTRVLAMGELAAAIAHEVNQPLAAIVTNANFCLRQLAGAAPNTGKLREAISEIVNDGTRASEVISRIRALLQKGAPERVELDINQVIEEVAVLLRDELTRNHVSLRTDLGADLPRVSGDRVQLQQVVINLVMNGIEAMRSLAHLPRELFIKSARNHNAVLIQVQDSGEGLDPQQAEHIFEPFFTTKPEGIGMGLSISRSIVESHGGRLWAESSSKGALFQFTLPAQ
jgi:PAS domain S-box-containing protein